MNDAFTTLVVLGFLIEVLTNVVKRIVPQVKEAKYSAVVAGVIGIILAVATQSGLLAATGVQIGAPIADQVLTGLILSRGANVIHDLVARLRSA